MNFGRINPTSKSKIHLYLTISCLLAIGKTQVSDFPLDLAESLSAISKYSHHIESFIPNWYPYVYDDKDPPGPQSIVDGGNNMYDTGNQISVSEIAVLPSQLQNIVYNTVYNFTEATFLAKTIYPFVALLKIKNNNHNHVAYSIGVYGQGNAKSVVTKFNGNVTSGSFTAKYQVFQTSGAGSPSICEVYFLLSSPQKWNSILPADSHVRFLNDPYNLDNRFSIAGTPSHIVVGYTLLSRLPSQPLRDEHVRKVMGLIMRLLGKDEEDKCTFLPQRCHDNAKCLSSPKVFKCICKKGFQGNGIQCHDIDECALNLHHCNPGTSCHNTMGSFQCVCSEGLTGDGENCTDVNECELNIDECHDAAACINTKGSYKCKCKDGYRGDGKVCDAYGTTCYDDSMIFHISSKLFDKMDVALSDFYLEDLKCQGEVDKKNADVWVFNVTTLEACGTRMSTNATHLIYSNTLLNYVYTEAAQRISFSCCYKRELKNLPFLTSSYKVLRSVVNLTAPSGRGEYTAELNRYIDNKYKRIDTRKQYKSTDNLYVMFKLVTSHADLNLVIKKCWITATLNPNDSLNYSFIDKGCPKRKLGHVNITRSGQGKIAQFESKVFGFTNEVITYLHCTLRICISKKFEVCTPACFDNIPTEISMFEKSSAGIQRKKRQATEDKNVVLSLGPLSTIRINKNDRANQNLETSFFLPFLTVLMICGTCSVVSCLSLVAFLTTIRKQNRKNLQ